VIVLHTLTKSKIEGKEKKSAGKDKKKCAGTASNQGNNSGPGVWRVSGGEGKKKEKNTDRLTGVARPNTKQTPKAEVPAEHRGKDKQSERKIRKGRVSAPPTWKGKKRKMRGKKQRTRPNERGRKKKGGPT